LAQLQPFFPTKRVATYFEPFLGGGAVFFHLGEQGLFERATLSDINADLIDCYTGVRNHVDAVISILATLDINEKRYYELRAILPADLPLPWRAARLIYLNRVGFNGLYRVNAAGLFNVPYGRPARPISFPWDQLRRAARALLRADLICDDFASATARATPSDFVYFDPPYLPSTSTARFVSYARRGFDLADHRRLVGALKDLRARNVPALLSNSDTPTSRALYAGLQPREILAPRNIAAAAAARRPAAELLISVGLGSCRGQQGVA
jgi:DNA adenine methylase